jgi:hypothetical protein
LKRREIPKTATSDFKFEISDLKFQINPNPPQPSTLNPQLSTLKYDPPASRRKKANHQLPVKIYPSHFTNHSSLPAAMIPMRKLVKINLAAQRVAVNAQQLRGAGLVSIRAVQHALDETLFEFADGLIE